MARRVSSRRGLGALALLCALATGARAEDGKIAIHQDCVASGCFPGDAPGFPVEITSTGSYVLTSNLVNASPSVDTIRVQAADVTLDLGGFALLGPAACSGAGAGVTCTNTGSGAGVRSTATGSTVRNGTVRGSGGAGVALSGIGGRAQDLRLFENGGRGIDAPGAGAGVSGCVLVRNGSDGLVAGDAAQVTESFGKDNKDGGLGVGESGQLTRNVAVGNGQAGLKSFGAGVVRQNFSGANLTGLQITGVGGYGENTFSNNPAVAHGALPPVEIGGNDCNGTPACP
jgi:hypothetical protein